MFFMSKLNFKDVWKSIGSLIGGVHSNKDTAHTDVMGQWGKHRDRSDFQNDDLIFYERIINRQKILWTESTHGAYVVIDCDLPEKIGKVYYDVPHATALFSKTPDALEKFISGESFDTSDIRTLPIHSHRDMSTNGHVEYTIFSKMISKHHDGFSERQAENNVFIYESDRLARSNTAVIYGIPLRKNPDFINYYLYTFPNAKHGLYVTEDVIDTVSFKSTILPLSIKISDKPVHKNDAQKFIENTANAVLNDYDIYIPPMKRYIDNASGLSKARKQISHSIKSFIQPITHLGARLRRVEFIKGAISSALLAVGIAMLSGVKAAGAGVALFSLATLRALALNNNNINKATNGVTKYLSRTLNRNRTNDTSRLYDRAPDFTSVHKIIETKRRIHYPMPDAFFDCIKLVDIGLASDEPLKKYNGDIKQKWGDKRQRVSDGSSFAIFTSMKKAKKGHAKFLVVWNNNDGKKSFPICKEKVELPKTFIPSKSRTLRLLGEKRHAKAEHRPGWLMGLFSQKSKHPTRYLATRDRVDSVTKSPHPSARVARDRSARRL
jgi:hypothetical protein